MCKMALENKRFIAVHEIQMEKLQAARTTQCCLT